MGVRRFCALSVALTLSLALAGCGGDPEPKIDASVSASPSVSLSPTEVETSASPVVQEESPEDFIRRWVGLYNQMQTSGDVSDFRAITSKCESCKRLADQIEGIYQDGGVVQTDGWTIASIKPVTSSETETEYEVTIDSAPTTYTLTADSPEQTSREDEFDTESNSNRLPKAGNFEIT